MALLTITWFGQSFFKLQAGDVTVAIDPYDAGTGLKPPRFNADLLLITHEHHDHNNRGTIMGQPFEVSSPGEYEVKGCTVYGVSGSHDGKASFERGAITMYRIEMEGIRLAHLGDIGQEQLTEKQLEVLDGVDVLFIPVGGKFTVNGTQAAKLVEQIEPRIIVPMHYKIPGLKIDLDGSEAFVKALGLPVTKESKLKLQKKDLNPDQQQLVLLESSL